MKSLWLRIATLGPIGYFPLPGTTGSFVSMFLVYLLHIYRASLATYSFATVLAFFVAVYVINRAFETMKRVNDPAEIVIDELVGVLITFWAVPFSLGWALVGFFLFRIFDISKWGIAPLEKIRGGLGVVLDDVAAGIISNIILHIFMYHS